MRKSSNFKNKTVTIISGHFNGSKFHVEDYWENVAGESWMQCNGNPTCLEYAVRSSIDNLPTDDNVLYGKIGGFGKLIHVKEIKEGT